MSAIPPPPQEYQAIVDAEWTILYDKLEKIVSSGAKVVLSKLPIGDVATQYFADRCVLAVGGGGHTWKCSYGLCVCASTCEYVHVCVCACVCVCTHACVCVCVYV